MASPFKQPEWSIEEAVLLAQASESAASDAMEFDELVRMLSHRLRCGAEAMGFSIGPRFRNEEEVKRNLTAITSMIKMLDFVEEDYFEGSSLGRAALLLKKDRSAYHRILDSANEKYPICIIPIHELNIETEQQRQEVHEPVTEYSDPVIAPRRKRPRIQRQTNIFSESIHSTDNKTSFGQPYFCSSIDTNAGEPLYKPSEAIQKNECVEAKPNEEEKQERPQSSYLKHIGLVREVLDRQFNRGFRLGSAIEIKRFRMAYKSLHGKTIIFTDENLESYIRNAGFEYDGKVYLIEKALSSQILDELKEYINNVFLSGRNYIFFKDLFEKFKDSFLDSQIVDAEMLRLYMKELNIKSWHIHQQYVASFDNVRVSVEEVVYEYIKEKHSVVSLDELLSDIDFLPQEQVEHAWSFSDGRLITNGRNEKFHFESFYITPLQINTVNHLISSALETSPFITGDALLGEIRINAPEIFENNSQLSNLGIRNALANILQTNYSFRNNIISRLEDAFDGPTAMIAFCKSKGDFTLEEAEGMSDLIGAALNIYLEKILEVSLRIDDSHFVPINAIDFDVEAIDKALSVFVKNEFIPISAIPNFEVFPSCNGYSWNHRLLESYLLTSSKKYKYLHPSFLGKDGIVGAIVKSESSLQSYEEVLMQAIAESDVEINESTASDYLFEIGLVARRKNASVKKVLQKAKERRNRLTQKKIDYNNN